MRILPIILAGFIVMGCTRGSDIEQRADDAVEFRFGLGTKAGSASDRTYMALLLRPISTNDYQSGLWTTNSGTYRQKDAKDWMTPCVVDAAGVWQADDDAAGLRATRGDYALMLVSPAVAPNWSYPSGSSKTKWGYLLDRAGDRISFCKPVNVSVGGNHLSGQYVYQIDPDNKLREMRSKITIKFRCGDDLSSVAVKKVQFKDFYATACYNLATDSLENFTEDNVGITLHSDTDPPLVLANGAAPQTMLADFYLFSLDYNSVDDAYHYNYTYPQLVLSIGDGTVSVPFTHNMEPQHSYEYVLTLNSAYESYSLTVVPWDVYSDTNVPISAPTTGTSALTPVAWDNVNPGTATIN